MINETKFSDIKSFKSLVKPIDKVDNRDERWVSYLPELMEKHGFKPIGAGKYGQVYSNPKYPYIIKIFMKDTAYLTYLNWVIKNQSNRFVPKVRGKVIKISDIFYSVRLEKLNEPWSRQTSKFLDLCSDPYDYIHNETKWKETNPLKFAPIMADDKDATALCELLIKHDNLLDIHRGNILQRDNETPVLIDPFYNWYKGKFTIDPDDVSKFEAIF